MLDTGSGSGGLQRLAMAKSSNGVCRPRNQKMQLWQLHGAELDELGTTLINDLQLKDRYSSQNASYLTYIVSDQQ